MSKITNFCQVIKGDERKCRNYSRKNKSCCYSHRKLENQTEVSSVDLRAQSLNQESSEPSTSDLNPDICYKTECKIYADSQIISKGNFIKYSCWKHC